MTVVRRCDQVGQCAIASESGTAFASGGDVP
eukprot:CAMPEP_0174754696 /NCGR_PEP_ID=MMETSP1094-20130205/105872_1 /TAXON_ID=156173 /ORGANISM="Chrysochromulina brevifilum, Strain UTEX LB 985" /LENGTH=30 /DNA_ID= /DNA_START= /DNA_END= /DNA_ORIENTATION=